MNKQEYKYCVVQEDGCGNEIILCVCDDELDAYAIAAGDMYKYVVTVPYCTSILQK